jgi:hypothetical protein
MKSTPKTQSVFGIILDRFVNPTKSSGVPAGYILDSLHNQPTFGAHRHSAYRTHCTVCSSGAYNASVWSGTRKEYDRRAEEETKTGYTYGKPIFTAVHLLSTRPFCCPPKGPGKHLVRLRGGNVCRTAAPGALCFLL